VNINLITLLIGQSAEAIRQAIESVDGFNASSADEKKAAYKTIAQKITPIIDYLLGLGGQSLLPESFNDQNLKEVQTALSSLPLPTSLKKVSDFCADLNTYKKKQIQIMNAIKPKQ
jgi:hypothetical protein